MLYEPLIEVLKTHQPDLNNNLLVKLARFDFLGAEKLLELNNNLFASLKNYLRISNPKDWCDSVSQISKEWYKRGAILEHCIWYFKEVFNEMEKLIEQELGNSQDSLLREKSVSRLRGLLTMTQITLTIADVKHGTQI